MSDGKFMFVEQYTKSFSTGGVIQYAQIFEHKDSSERFEFVVKVDIENYLVSITGPGGKVWSQDVRENTDRAKKAMKWYNKAKILYNDRMNLNFTPTYKE